LLAVSYLREAEGLDKLAEPPGGSDTRWPYWIDCAVWFAPWTARYENLLTFLLHTWLVAQGDAGIGLPSRAATAGGDGGKDSSGAAKQSAAPLGGAELVAQIQLIKERRST
jgi:hypothetical protein